MNPLMLPQGATSAVFGIPLPAGTPPIAPTPEERAANEAANVDPGRLLPNSTAHYEERDGKHRGVAGTARDILGFLGDFLLTRLHMPAMYGPAQQRRKLALAQDGFGTTPQATADAINRVADIDPQAALKMRDQYIDNQRLAAAQASTAESRDARLAAAKALQDDRTRSRAAAMLGTMATWDDNRRATNYGALRDQAIRYGQANGLDLSNELPTTFDPIQLDSFIDGAVPVGTQRSQRLTRERMDQQQSQFEQRDATTRRGQDITSGDRRRGQDVTARGQDIRSADTRRGQDITSADRRTGQQERGRHNRAMEARPGRFTPDPNKIYVQNGRRFRYNAQTRTYDPVN